MKKKNVDRYTFFNIDNDIVEWKKIISVYYLMVIRYFSGGVGKSHVKFVRLHIKPKGQQRCRSAQHTAFAYGQQ